MDNETKLSKNQIDAMKNELQNSKDKKEPLSTTLKRLLNESQEKEITKIFSDPTKLKEILSSPAFKKFMKENGKREE